jgi:hypothetical protein
MMKIVADGQNDYMGLFTFDPALDNASAFSKSANQKMSMVHTHVDWISNGELQAFNTVSPTLGTSVVELARNLAQNDSVLAVSWDPMAINFLSEDLLAGEAPVLSMSNILDGGLDTYIGQIARQVADAKVPMMMNLFGEADSNGLFAYGTEGNQFHGQVSDLTGAYGDPTILDGPERVRDVFKYVIDLFNAEGANNVTWFMYMGNKLTVPQDSLPPELFYPGDDYIDWVGQSLYLKNVGELSANFDAGYNAWAAITNKPFIIAEMGLEVTGGTEVAALVSALKNYSQVGAYTWADFDGLTEDWSIARLGSSEGDWSALQAATDIQSQVMLSVGGELLDLRSWYEAAGLLVADTTFSGTSGSDYLLGSASGDLMSGYDGDDFYIVNNRGDRIIEKVGDGYDTVRSQIDHVLANNVEALQMEGQGAISGTGNQLDNTLIGNSGANLLRGRAGNDVLDSGGGGDTLRGGSGDDTYLLRSALDQVFEGSGRGNDTVISSFSSSLSANVENLVFEGSSNVVGSGNAQDNSMSGNAGNNRLLGRAGDDTLRGMDGNDTLKGGAGNDLLEGGAGNDRMTGGPGIDALSGGIGDDRLILTEGADFAEGGAGADVFEFHGSGGIAVIGDFTAGEDVLDMTAFGLIGYSELAAAVYDAGDSVLIQLGEDGLFLRGLTMSEFSDSLVLI